MADNQTRLNTLRAIADGTDHRPPTEKGRNSSRLKTGFVVVLLLGLGYTGAHYFQTGNLNPLQLSSPPSLNIATEHSPNLTQPASDMVAISGGQFLMGHAWGPIGSKPEHLVSLRSFQIERHEVTNAQFAEFITATGYQTTAQRLGKSIVAEPSMYQAKEVHGADWEHPLGPTSTIQGRELFPVVHVSWTDANAYAQWAGKRLPTEAEWEYAARGSLADSDYPWGRTDKLDQRVMANTGKLRAVDADEDHFSDLAPVGQFPASSAGLYDIIGNVSEWCADYYSEDAYELSSSDNPQGPVTSIDRVVRGGHWFSKLGQKNSEATTWFRQHSPPNMTSNYTGFRCAQDSP
ncbi:MAG: hypothetical protein COA78_12855 [Blastopirellula sp.]|nr:MAG: hypothetical protein COA78_12855 [Blastopirellula sp.]